MNRQAGLIAPGSGQRQRAVDACPANKHLRQQPAAADLDALPDIHREHGGRPAVGFHLDDVVGALGEIGGHERAVIVADGELFDHGITGFIVMLDVLREIADHDEGIDAFAFAVEALYVTLAFPGKLDVNPEIAGVVLAVHGVPP